MPSFVQIRSKLAVHSE